MKRDYSRTEEKIVSCLGVKWYEKVLEIGCGQGYFSEMLVSMTNNLFSVDPNEESLMIAKQKFSRASVKPKFYRLAGEDLFVFPDNSFEIIFFPYSLHHHRDPEKALTQAMRMLSANGRIFIIEPRANGDYCRFLEPLIDEREVLAKADQLLKTFPCGQREKFEYVVDWYFKDRQDLFQSLKNKALDKAAELSKMLNKYPQDQPIIIKDRVVIWTLLK